MLPALIGVFGSNSWFLIPINAWESQEKIIPMRYGFWKKIEIGLGEWNDGIIFLFLDEHWQAPNLPVNL
jgi:hypothetical protein